MGLTLQLALLAIVWNTSQMQCMVRTGSSGCTTQAVLVQPDVQAQELVYPKSPQQFGLCRLVINEFKTGRQFLETKKVCKESSVGRTTTSLRTEMDGFHYLVVVAKPKLEIISTMDLTGEKVGIDNIHLLDFQTSSTAKTATTSFLPESNTSHTVLLLLLYVKVGQRAAFKKHLSMDSHNGVLQQKSVSAEGLLQNTLQDFVAYGKSCDLANQDPHCAEIATLLGSYYHKKISFGELREDYLTSINRCCDNAEPMQLSTFKMGFKSPGSENLCDVNQAHLISGYVEAANIQVTMNYPFSFSRVCFQHQAQQMMINALYFFNQAKSNPTLLNDDPLTMASRVTNVGRESIAEFKRRADANEAITTPGKKRPRGSNTLKALSKFDVDWIRKSITDIYKENRVPILDELYKKFITYKETFDPDTAEWRTTKTRFCSFNTYAKLIHLLGYKHGRLSNRWAVLQRPSLVQWRILYLRAIFKNLDSDIPMDIVYTDETWIDPFARIGKGWVPRDQTSPKLMAQYTQQTSKIGKGPRLIVLNAGTVGGLMKNVMKVYKIAKTSSMDDFHQNVDGETYLKWFGMLMDELDVMNRTTKRGFLIVMDNVPYHSVNTAPAQKEKKAVLYEWLKKRAEEGELDEELQPINRMLKPEIWSKVQNLKKVNNYYKVDQMARQRGFRVLRLPPYNCDLNPIEEVWHDVKVEVKKQNTEQNLDKVKAIAETVMTTYPVAKWEAHVNHIRQLEKKYWSEDVTIENAIDRIVIEIGNEEEDDDDQEPENIHGGFSVEHDFDTEEPLYTEEENELGSLMRAPKRQCLTAKRLFRND